MTKGLGWKTFLYLLDEWKFKQVNAHFGGRAKHLDPNDILVTQGQFITIAVIKTLHNKFKSDITEMRNRGRLPNNSDPSLTVELD